MYFVSRSFHVLKAIKENHMPQLPAGEREETYTDLVFLMDSFSKEVFESRLANYQTKVRSVHTHTLSLSLSLSLSLFLSLSLSLSR
jgi:hypothetical protein